MRIAVNAVRVSKKSGGGFETYVINTVNHLARIHPELDVYTLYPEHFPSVPQDHLVRVGPGFRRPPGLAAAGRFGLSGDSLRMLWTQAFLPAHLFLKNYDLFFASTHLDALPFSPVPQVVNVQDTIPLVFPEQEHKYVPYLRHVLPTVYRRADHLLAVSENTKKDMTRFYGIPAEKITVIYEAIDHSLFRPQAAAPEKLAGWRLPEKFILSVSSNLPHKNLPRLIEAYGSLRKDVRLPLVIIGFLTPKYQKEIGDIMGRSGLTDSDVRFLGHFPMKDLPAIYSACTCFAFASLYEGFGFPPLEAMASGAPVVVSKAASIPEVVGDAGAYVDPLDPDSIAEGLRKVLSDQELRKDMSRKGLDQAKKFTWEKTAAQTLRVFREVLAGRKGT